jgi:iron complex transport system substrate-binding protein
MTTATRTAVAAVVAVAVVAGVPAVAVGTGAATGGNGHGHGHGHGNGHDAGATPPAAVGAATAGTAASAQDDCTFPHTVTDATGTEVRIDEAPERVVTTNPSAAQTMWEIGAREKVVGVSRFATYLDGADSRANVSASGFGFSVERVVGQQPDLVLVPNASANSHPGRVRRLRDAGLTVHVFGFATSIEDVIEKTRLTGRLVGACEGADERADRMVETMDTVHEAVNGTDRPRVMYYFFDFTAGNETFVHEVLTAAGGDNIAANVTNRTGYYRISDETVLIEDPEWIVLNTDDPDGEPPHRTAYNFTTAVRENQVVVVDTNHLNQPAPRVVRVVRRLAETFHPEAYAAANRTPTPTPDPDPPAAGGGGGSDDDDDDDDDGSSSRSRSTATATTGTTATATTGTTATTETPTATTATTRTATSTGTPTAETTPTRTATSTGTPTAETTPTVTTATTATRTATSTAGTAATASDSSTPGFGPVPALLALCGLAGLSTLALRRR